jgi:hypothetical protein
MKVTLDWAIYFGFGIGYDRTEKAWVILLPFCVIECKSRKTL